MLKRLAALLTAFLALAASAAGTAIYDESADAKAQIAAALRAAGGSRQQVLVVFGANWCGDCRMLDTAFKSGASAALIAARFKVVKVDVGRFDRNVDVAETYGVPLKKGIPAVVLLNAEGRPAAATRSGELADARKMGDQGIHDFFTRLDAAPK
ncbi:Thioredoxin family protein [Rubrivivax sp. A210]|uniref:thioredoxin family protein n=1 Tax=Rubrivivax sp. A210 TaxID=2772301 RepID=UPI001917E094|nr:thioredoxin family protein [Rubrivivax sp. A210]CAD5371355.1 Thioredoxin family protein [Rubrivivax sp. A210]